MKIVVGNINMRVFPQVQDEVSVLKELLTFAVPGAEFSYALQKKRWDGKVRLYKIKDSFLIVKSGLKDWLQKKLVEKGFSVDVENPIEKLPIKPAKLRVSFREYQKEIVDKCVEVQRGLVRVATGGGKTLIGAGIASSFSDKKVLYIVHRRELLTQVVETMEKTLGEKIGRIGSGAQELNRRVTVGMVQTLYSRMRLRKDVADWMEEVDVVVVDECHHSAGAVYGKVMLGLAGASVRIGLTGTLPPEESLEGIMIKGLFGEQLCDVGTMELQSGGFVARPVVKFIKGEWTVGLREKVKVNWMKRNATTKYWEEVRRLAIVENEKRNRLISTAQGNGVLIVVDILEHGERLKERIPDSVFVWAGSEDRDRIFERFRKGEIRVLITSPVLEEGIDVKGIRTVVMASGGKSKRKLLQRIGRGLRMDVQKEVCVVFDFFDVEVPMLRRHSEERLKVYEEEGFEVQKYEETLSD